MTQQDVLKELENQAETLQKTLEEIRTLIAAEESPPKPKLIGVPLRESLIFGRCAGGFEMNVESKILEVRDVATCIPILAVRFVASSAISPQNSKAFALIRRAGWGIDDPVTQICRLVDTGTDTRWLTSGDLFIYEQCTTICVALQELHLNWDKYKTGDVVECGYLSGRVSAPQGSDL